MLTLCHTPPTAQMKECFAGIPSEDFCACSLSIIDSLMCVFFYCSMHTLVREKFLAKYLLKYPAR